MPSRAPAPSRRPPGRARPTAHELARLNRDDLLDLRMSDLDLRIEGTWVERIVDRVRRDLARRGLRLDPTFYVGDEWCSPDGIPGVALPFYLFHPRLLRLERSMMFEAEGSSRAECLMLLRHEVGHAFQHAYALQRRRGFQQAFGTAVPYPDQYRPDPKSKRFVFHLPGWYAQSHPAEDFAETFAVWLDPHERWRTAYKGWPAMRKLKYVDELMSELQQELPKVRTRRKPYAVSSLHHTLREHYAHRKEHYQPGYSDAYDRDLLKLFSSATRYRNNETAAAVLRRNRSEVREQVASWTGEYQVTVDMVLREMIGRCRVLKLRLTTSERKTKLDFVIMLTVHTVHRLHRRHEWHTV